MHDNRRRIGSRTRRGVALLDAIIGGIILSIGLGTALSVTARSLSAQTGGEKRMVAAWLAEELLAMVVVEGPVAYPQLHDTAGTFEEPFEAFQFELDIAERGMGEPYLVSAEITWDGRDDGIRVESLIALRQGDPIQLREPMEPVDRELRHLENDPEF